MFIPVTFLTTSAKSSPLRLISAHPYQSGRWSALSRALSARKRPCLAGANRRRKTTFGPQISQRRIRGERVPPAGHRGGLTVPGIGTAGGCHRTAMCTRSGLPPADTKDSRSTTLRSCAEGAVVRLERAVPTAMDRGRTRDKLRGAAQYGREPLGGLLYRRNNLNRCRAQWSRRFSLPVHQTSCNHAVASVTVYDSVVEAASARSRTR
jgi:hypothetical protein